MKSFCLTPVIAVFLLSLSIGIQAQNKPVLKSAINSKMYVRHLQGNPMPSMQLPVRENQVFKANLLPQGFKNAHQPKNLNAKEIKQIKSATAGIQLRDRVIIEIRDTITNKLVVDEKYEYSYEANGNLSLNLISLWDKTVSQWYIWAKEEFTYDANKNLTLYVLSVWDEPYNQWYVWAKEKYTYDANENLTIYMDYNWSDISNKVVANSKKEYTYEASGDNKSWIIYNWDVSTNKWVADYKWEFTYDLNGDNTLNIRSNWDAKTSQWVVGNKEEITYQGIGNNIWYNWSDWDVNTSDWVASQKEILTYDYNGNNTENNWLYWDVNTSQWYNFSKEDYTYDDYGNLTMYIGYDYFDIDLMDWVANKKEELTYDANGNLTLYIYYIRDESTSQLIADSKKSFYYSEHNITNIPEIPENQISVYPNPASNKISITTSSNKSYEQVLISIFSINGQLIRTDKFQKQERFEMDVSTIAKGIYLMKIQSNEGVETQKLVLQ